MSARLGGCDSVLLAHPAPVTWRDILVPVPTAVRRIRVRCYEPSRASRGVVVWAHGGSWVGGSIEAWHEPCAALARACRTAVLSVDYRLAPRWPHPAPVEDLTRVLTWVAARFGADTPPLMIGGDSAGATLAACVALRCRDTGLALTAQVLAYPPLDPSCSQPSYRRFPRSFPAREAMLDAWWTYRGSGSSEPGEDSYFTPWTVADLRGLPPAVIGVGECDPVADDSLRFAERLRQQGNRVELRSFARVGHGMFFYQRADGSFPLQEWIAEALPLSTPSRDVPHDTEGDRP